MQTLEIFIKGLGVVGGLFALAAIVALVLLFRASAVVMDQMAEDNEP